MNLLRMLASKMLPDSLEEVLFSPQIQKAIEYAGTAISQAKEFKTEIDAVETAVKALTNKIKEKAKASSVEWDDKPAEMLDNFVDKTIEVLRGIGL